MSRKVIVKMEIVLTLDVDEGVEIGDVIDEMDYEFTPEDSASIVDTEIRDYHILDSR